MNIATGKVIGGKVVVEGDVLVEGARVTVLTHDDDETFEATPEQEGALLAAISEADLGDFVSSDQLLKDLRRSA
jgi:redox-sensitive bicupin YhaK (pirin superfamily)